MIEQPEQAALSLHPWHAPVFSILVFLGLYRLHNIRKPLNVAFISDQITSEVMASGLSVESQLVTLLMAAILGFSMAALAMLTQVTAPRVVDDGQS